MNTTPTLAPPVTLTRRVIITATVPFTGNINDAFDEAEAAAKASVEWYESIEYVGQKDDGFAYSFDFAVSA